MPKCFLQLNAPEQLPPIEYASAITESKREREADGNEQALIRAQKFTFAGDERALTGAPPALHIQYAELTCRSNGITAAHLQTRVIFSRFAPSSATASPTTGTTPGLTGTEVDVHITSAFEIASYLRKNVVQGIEKEDGKYSASHLLSRYTR